MAVVAGKGATETDTFVGSQPKVAPTKWQSFMTFLYEKETGKVFGRTGKSWLQITIFYLIFYGVLAAFFAVLLILFLQTLDPHEPKWKGHSGIIGDNPGMGFRPTPPDTGSTLIWVKRNTNTTQKYINNLGDFLQKYEAGQQPNEQMMNCGLGAQPTQENKKACVFPISTLGPCNKEKAFGYNNGQPCVLLKLNKIYGWNPELPIRDVSEKDHRLQDLREAYARQNVGKALDEGKLANIVYVTCGGADAVDKEHIGPIKLYPEGLSKDYFPFTNAPGYLSPIVMVEFQNPDPGVLINVECKAWAQNIQHSRTDRLGTKPNKETMKYRRRRQQHSERGRG